MSDPRIRPRRGFAAGGDGVWGREPVLYMAPGRPRVGWASEEASDLVSPPQNLVLYVHLRIFAYTSNALIASFEYMELMLVSGTLKNFMFLLKSCLSTDRTPVIKIICSTFQPWRCHSGSVSPYLWRSEGGVLVLDCTLDPDEVSFADIAHSFMFQITEGPDRIAYG
jgi:hypothetical protein